VSFTDFAIPNAMLRFDLATQIFTDTDFAGKLLTGYRCA
jgi:hypothetical protein